MFLGNVNFLFLPDNKNQSTLNLKKYMSTLGILPSARKLFFSCVHLNGVFFGLSVASFCRFTQKKLLTKTWMEDGS